jgi:hypothetical protein
MQSYYTRNPLGKIKITNIEGFRIFDIEVSFFQSGYMDSPILSASIPSLEPGESVKVGIIASFNEEIFKTEGTMPLTGEIIVKYSSKGRPAEQRQSIRSAFHVIP